VLIKQENQELQDALKQARAEYFERIRRCEEKEKELESKVAVSSDIVTF
jgi:hypothetical protein